MDPFGPVVARAAIPIRSLALAATVALAVVAGPVGAVRAQQPPGSPAGSSAPAEECWTTTEIPAELGASRINEILATDEGLWLFGVPTPEHGHPVALLRRDGSWSDTEPPWGGGAALLGADAEPGGDTWVVGSERPKPEVELDLHASMHPIAGRWTTAGWTDEPVPLPSGEAGTLTDVEALATGRALAVGTRLASGATHALVVRWEGGWVVDNPGVDADESGLTAVTSATDGTVWAVGWRLVDGLPRPLVLRLVDGTWETMALSGLPQGAIVLTDVDLRAVSDGFAAGYRVPTGDTRYVPLLLHWDGRAWSPVDLPWAADASAVPLSVAVGDGDAVLLTGGRVAVNGGWTRAFTAHRQGGTWEVRRADTKPYQNSELVDGEYLGGRPLVAGRQAGHATLSQGCDRLEQPSKRRAPRGEAPASPGAEDGAVSSAAPLASGRPAATPGPSSIPSTASRDVEFVDLAVTAGVYEETDSYGGVSADFDADGWPDVFYSRPSGEQLPRLLLGGSSGFRDVADAPFLNRDRQGCAVADVDADGLVDLFCTHGRSYGTAMGSHELWLRPGTDPDQVTADMGVVDPFGRGRLAAFLNLDGDVFPDLYVVNEPERTDGQPSLNRLFRDDGGGRFLPAPQPGVDGSMGGRCATAADLDADGDDELLLCTSEPSHGLPAGLRVFRNETGSLRETTGTLGLEPIGDIEVVVADFDGDGRATDIAQLGTRSLRVSLEAGGGYVRSFEMPVTDGVALAGGDADGDGRADLYVVRSSEENLPDLVLLNGGTGRAFREAQLPQATTGIGDDAIAIDHDRDGLVAFLVLNGRGAPGPVQLIAPSPVP